LSDGKVINLGEKDGSGGVIAANGKTFVGVIDTSDKGISSITLHVQGTAERSQPLFIEDLAFAMAGPPPGDWKLTLSDDFNGDKLDPNIWSTGYKFVDVINNELQGFVPENVTVANGVCSIKTEYRDCRNTDRFGNEGHAQKFASGAFTSVDKFTQTYGYFEARIKMPKARGAGVWPAFWALPDRGKDYPDKVRYGYMNDYGRGMEIDVFEFMPRWKTLAGTVPVHMGCIWSYGPPTEKDPAPHGYGGFARDNDGWGPQELDFPNLDDQFHTYGLYWSPERLIWYIDSKPVFRAKDPKHMPDVPHFFLFNVSVQGNGWGKSPDKKNPTMAEIIEDMPNEMQIDYFRAYSGTLEEAVPAASSDVPGVVTRYKPPLSSAPADAKPATAPASAPADAPGTPAAPANSHIASPSNG
jgi:beta-glucanase (GH16 family)